MRALIFLLGWPALAAAAIGDPCDAMDCPPGEICVGVDERYCTKRCPPGGCPEGFVCDRSSGIPVCLRERPPVPRAGFGEPCGVGVMECEDDLTCATDGVSQFCTRACRGPGSCPEGFRCAPGENPACAPRAGASGFGEPCATRGCLDPLECIEHPSRQGPFCTQDCSAGITCSADWVCDGVRCLPPQPALPGFGEACILESDDPSQIGCAGDLRCIVDGLDTYCTRACSSQDRCPDGYGCVAQPDGRGECRRGAEDDFAFRPQEMRDIPMRPAPPSDAGPPMAEEGGGGDGCNAVGSLDLGAGLFGLLGLVLRRRRG